MSLLLSIDPGSTSCGVSIFDLETGDLVTTACYKADKKDTWGIRFKKIVTQFKDTLLPYAKDVTEVCYERNSTHANDVLTMVVAMFIVWCPKAKVTQARSGISPSKWKGIVRRRARIGGDVKGCDALEILRPGWVDQYDLGEDEADSCLVGLAWLMGQGVIKE